MMRTRGKDGLKGIAVVSYSDYFFPERTSSVTNLLRRHQAKFMVMCLFFRFYYLTRHWSQRTICESNHLFEKL